jgi:isoquinoline 1-oxidoreductase subunit alpha
MITIQINNTNHSIDVESDTPLLWVLRDHLKLTGTKFGCGEGLCGACTVLIDGQPARSCQTTLAEAQNKKITTIEGIPFSHPLKKAWLAEEVSQCGYCQPGQIMNAIGLLSAKTNVSDSDIDNAMSGNLCRCGTYDRIRKAIHVASVPEGEKS